MDQVEKIPLFSDNLCNLAQDLLDFCFDHSCNLGTAESLTGGLIGALFTSIPGASATYAGGCVVYQTEQKHIQLDVSKHTLAHFGPVSEECAQEMVRGVQKRLGVECALITTGVAGPATDEFNVAVGTVYVAAAYGSHINVFNYAFDPELGREEIRLKTVSEGLSDSLAFFKSCV